MPKKRQGPKVAIDFGVLDQPDKPTAKEFDCLSETGDEVLDALVSVKVCKLREFYRNTKPPTLKELRKQRQVWRGLPGCSQEDPGVEADIAFIKEWADIYYEDREEEATEYDF